MIWYDASCFFVGLARSSAEEEVQIIAVFFGRLGHVGSRQFHSSINLTDFLHCIHRRHIIIHMNSCCQSEIASVDRPRNLNPAIIDSSAPRAK